MAFVFNVILTFQTTPPCLRVCSFFKPRALFLTNCELILQELFNARKLALAGAARRLPPDKQAHVMDSRLSPTVQGSFLTDVGNKNTRPSEIA